MNATTVHSPINLRVSLAQEDWYMSQQTRNWLQQTPPDQAIHTLIRLAEDAQPEPHSLLDQTLLGLRMFFLPAENITSGHSRRRVGTRAALMLADLGDARCIPPLVRVFELNPMWQGKYQELVEAALTRFLSEESHLPELQPYENELRQLAERIWNKGKGKQELPRPLTELLLAVLNCLHQLGGQHNLDVLRSVAAVPTSKPNRSRIKAVAHTLVDGTAS